MTTTPTANAFNRTFVLGETSEIIRLQNLDAFRLADLRLVQQAKRRVVILTPDLEPARFDNEEFAEAISVFARSHPAAHVRIVVGNPKIAVSDGHHLVRLAQRLSSKISIRQAAPDRYDGVSSHLLADGMGLVRKQDEDYSQGYVDAKSLSTAPMLERQFDEIFQYGIEIPDFRRLSL